jgi:hypothetical protein
MKQILDGLRKGGGDQIRSFAQSENPVKCLHALYGGLIEHNVVRHYEENLGYQYK